jgi:hypothetical protein
VGNDREGILHEISHQAVIRHNTIVANGGGKHTWLWGGGVVVSTSDHVEIYGNDVRSNGNGITAVQQDRGSGPRGPYRLDALFVHDNNVSASGETGVAQDVGDPSVFSRSLLFANNTYRGGAPLAWADDDLSWPRWQSYGKDLTGSWG